MKFFWQKLLIIIKLKWSNTKNVNKRVLLDFSDSLSGFCGLVWMMHKSWPLLTFILTYFFREFLVELWEINEKRIGKWRLNHRVKTNNFLNTRIRNMSLEKQLFYYPYYFVIFINKNYLTIHTFMIRFGYTAKYEMNIFKMYMYLTLL